MKPPTEPIQYGDKKWGEVRKCLAVIGVDADTATVGQKQRPLRSELEWLAQRYCDNEPARTPTVREFMYEATGHAKKIAAVRDLFAPRRMPVAYVIGNERAVEIYRLLDAAETELLEEAESARVGRGYARDFRDGGRHDNACKPEWHDYLLRLAAIWDELAGASSAPRHRNRFVRACAALIDPISIRYVRDFLSKKTQTTI